MNVGGNSGAALMFLTYIHIVLLIWLFSSYASAVISSYASVVISSYASVVISSLLLFPRQILNLLLL